MDTPKEISVLTKVMRHQSQFSRLLTIPSEVLAPWKLTDSTIVEGEINNVEFGRRTLKRGDDRLYWWIDLPQPLCKQANVDTGDWVTLKIRVASEELPAELAKLIMEDSLAAERWSKLTESQQRMLREDVFAARTSEARTRRALRVLGRK
jgi:hypothetical protein